MATQKSTTHTLRGRLRNLQNEPLQGLIVRAYAKTAGGKEKMLGGEARSDAEGRYAITFKVSDSAKPVVFVRVFAGSVPLGESAAVQVAKPEIQIDLELEAGSTPAGTGLRRVSGAVRNAAGKPLTGLLVIAVDRDLRREQALGQAHTGRDGRYEIGYAPGRFARAEKERADLVVRVLDEKKGVLAESATVFNAPEDAVIDLIVSGHHNARSEYEELVEEIQPLLDGLALPELQEKDIAFLSGETNRNADFIAYLIEAQRLLQKTKVQAEAFYGMFRQGLPTGLAALIARGSQAQLNAPLAQSVRQ